MPQVMKDFNTIGLYYSSQILKKTIVMRVQKITNLEKDQFKNKQRGIPVMVS